MNFVADFRGMQHSWPVLLVPRTVSRVCQGPFQAETNDVEWWASEGQLLQVACFSITNRMALTGCRDVIPI